MIIERLCYNGVKLNDREVLVEDEGIPTLMQMIYGEQAWLAAQGASERFLRWCAAFEAWLESYPAHKKVRMTLPWRELLSSSQKMPWQVTEEDVREYMAELEERGYANGTIHEHRRQLERFYEWCDEHAVGRRGFNPVRRVPKPKLSRYSKAQLLSAAEARQLLAALGRDDSPLGKRDYAFTLARLMLGVQLKALLELRWGQIQVEKDQVRVLWAGRKARRERLPGVVWEAIRDYLTASGRLAGMQADDYIFAKLANPIAWEGGRKAEEWKAGEAISIKTVRRSLHKVGRLAGIAEEKLRLPVLRYTATKLRMEAGDDLQEIKEFRGDVSQDGTSTLLVKLSELPEGAESGGRWLEERPISSEDDSAPAGSEEDPNHRKPGRKMIHGLYAKRQPDGEMADILKENLQGLDQEIAGLQLLNHELFELLDQVENNHELARLVEVSGRSEARLADLVRANKELTKRRKKGGEEYELRARLEKLANDLGSSLEEWGAPGTGETRQDEWAQSIARLRLAMRRILAMMEGEQEINMRVRYTDLYGVTCVKLAKLLRLQTMGDGSLFTWWLEAVDEARESVVEELGLSI